MLNPLSHQGTPQIFSLCHLFDFLSCLFWLLLFLIYTFNFNILSLNFLSCEILCFNLFCCLSCYLCGPFQLLISLNSFISQNVLENRLWIMFHVNFLCYFACDVSLFVCFCLLLLPHLWTFYSFLFSPLWYGWIVYICYAPSDFKKNLKMGSFVQILLFALIYVTELFLTHFPLWKTIFSVTIFKD